MGSTIGVDFAFFGFDTLFLVSGSLAFFLSNAVSKRGRFNLELIFRFLMKAGMRSVSGSLGNIVCIIACSLAVADISKILPYFTYIYV